MRTLPHRWGRTLQEQALANARAATTELSRRRVEREEVEIFVTERYAGRRAAESPGTRPA